MSKEVIEIRDTDPNVDEQIKQIKQILRPKPTKATSNWENVIDPNENVKAVSRYGEISSSKAYRYPIYGDLKVELKPPCLIESDLKDAICTRIEHHMLRQNKTDAVLICETKDRVSKSKRKDKTKTAPQTMAKLIIPTLNDIESTVKSLVQRINNLNSRIPADGILVRFRLGIINTLEFISSSGEDDEFRGF